MINREIRKKNIWISLKKQLRKLGPGLITGASDDDPSGILTYSQAGAMFGMKFLWTAVATYPLMVNIQEMCARIGLVTRQGLVGVIKKYYPPWILFLIIGVCFPAIIFNLGADVAAMAAVCHTIFPEIPVTVYAVLVTGFLLYILVFWNYRKITKTLKWLCVSLFAYLIIPFLYRINYLEVLESTLLPQLEWSKEWFLMLVGILGTTISPYLFFWQANMEVEEVKQKHLMVDKHIITDMESDIKTGMLLTNMVFFFIVLTTGTVLFPNGKVEINSVEDAAMALKPLAGNKAFLLFALGVMGTGLITVPVLAGSVSYMISEALGWKEGLNKKFSHAKGFYLVMIISLFIGLLIVFLDLSPVKMLLYAAVFYGITSPVLIGIIWHICNRSSIMGLQINTRQSNIITMVTFVLMLLSILILIYFEFLH